MWSRAGRVSRETVRPGTHKGLAQPRSSRCAASASACLAWTSGSSTDGPLPSTDVRGLASGTSVAAGGSTSQSGLACLSHHFQAAKAPPARTPSDRQRLGEPSGPGPPLVLADQLLDLLGRDLAAQRGQCGGAAGRGLVADGAGRGHRLLDPRPGVVGGLAWRPCGCGRRPRGRPGRPSAAHACAACSRRGATMGAVLDTGLLGGLRHLRREPYACLVRVVRGPVLGRVGVGRHHFRGVQHAVLRRAGRGAHAVDAGHGILLLGGVRYFDFPPFYGSCLPEHASGM